MYVKFSLLMNYLIFPYIFFGVVKQSKENIFKTEGKVTYKIEFN